MEWEQRWTRINNRESARGGQGTIDLVANKITGENGALKRLHERFMYSRERRGRMAREVIALKTASGTGVPRVLDENTSAWETREELFVVLEYISGDTLQKYVSDRPQSLDTALDLTEKLVEIVCRTHASQVIHRDIKPDNIILKDNNVRDPVLVDFGLAWLEHEDNGFQSRVNQEIGNRFLRLPEHAADQDSHHDLRSDLTQIVGVLLYLLSGVYPRLLVDANGRRPDEVSRNNILPETLGDVRWPSVQSIFIMGFQQNIDTRFQSADELHEAIIRAKICKENALEDADRSMLRAREELSQLFRSSAVAQADTIRETMLLVAKAFLTGFREALSDLDLAMGGSGPNAVSNRVRLDFFIVRRGMSEPMVRFTHDSVTDGRIIEASWGVEGRLQEKYWEGPAFDREWLLTETTSASKICALRSVQLFQQKLE